MESSAATAAAFAIDLPSSTGPSFARFRQQPPFINLETVILTARAGHNPHNASPARGFVQSGLQ
jgi:hypothetical protein